MRFNSTQRAEPYPGLTCACTAPKGVSLRGWRTGAAWLSSARVVRCWVKSRNERNPRGQLPTFLAGPPAANRRKVGTTSSHHGPYVQGHTRATMGRTEGCEGATRSESQQSRSQLGLQAATRLHERGVASNRGSAHRGEYVPGPCTHRPSRHESWTRLKSARQPGPREAAAEGGASDWDEVVTR